jgi:hypothetical protein
MVIIMMTRQLFLTLFPTIIGLGMITQWIFFAVKKQIPELKTEPIRIGFHLAGEFITAILLILSGVGLLLGWDVVVWLYPLAIGMLLYTAIVSPGYFAQKGQWGFVWMFAVIIFLALVSLMWVF